MRGSADGAIGLALAVTLGGLTACGDADAPPSGRPGDPAASATQSWAERLAEPRVPTLLAALAQPHAIVRGPLGAHRLQATVGFSLAPSVEVASRPAVDQPVVNAQQVHDELTLLWTPGDGEPRLWLVQANNHERGREVIVIGSTVHVKKAHRDWHHYPQDSALVELWLNDAQRTVHDAVQLAAPRLALEPASRPGEGLESGDAVEITLGFSDDYDPEQIADGPTQGWRRRAEIQAVEGAVRLDARTGAWLAAEIEVRYTLPSADGQTLEGRVHLTGRVEPLASVEVEAPAGSRPLPKRPRYDHEQQQLLDGLAAP